MKNLLTILLLVLSTQIVQAQYSLTKSNAKFIASKKPVVKIKKDQKYTFGYLEVPENRSQEKSNTIRLPVFIFKSRSKQPKKDPIIYIIGGPGSSIMRNAPYMQYYEYLDDRDFILFEQRGTRYAQPHLDCPEWSNARYQVNSLGLDELQEDSVFQKAALDCKKRLLKKGIDLNGYNTDETAADIEDLRKVLNIEQYNLLTISYGTKVAQVLMRDYPDHIRSVVMDSPLPLEVSYDEVSIQNLLKVYDKVFQDCATDQNCSQAFPNLKNRFFKFLKNITENPLDLQVTNPQDQKVVNFKLRGRDLIGLLPSLHTADMPNIPYFIAQILNGDYSLIKEELESLLKYPGDGAGMGMRLSVWCAEETPFASRKVIQEESQKYESIKGAYPATVDPEICDIWGVKPLDNKANQAIKSDIPTLIISGEYDNETPVKFGELLKNNLSNSYHFVFKGYHHGPTTYWDNPCGMKLANVFFNNPIQEPGVDCFKTIKTPVFKVE